MATGDVDQQEPMLAFDGFSNLEDDDDPSAMSLVDHLEELRWRILKSVIAIAIGTVIAFIFRDTIIHFLEAPLPRQANALSATTGGNLVITGLAEGFTVTLLVSFVVGVVIALPVLLYQIWAFIAPGLYEREKKYAVPFIFIGIVLFVIGISLGYVVLRYPVEFLVTFSASYFTELVTANSYFTFVAFFELAFGIIFEMPLVLTFMAKVGLVSLDVLKEKRPAVHVGMWIAACFITPGADIFSPLIIGVSMSLLFELTILFISITQKSEPETA